MNNLHRKLVLLLWLVVAITIFAAGCSTANGPNEVILESGAIDTDYTGDPDPQLVVEMKLTPKERTGVFEKVPAKTISSKAELEVEEEDNTDREVGEADAPRPKI